MSVCSLALISLAVVAASHSYSSDFSLESNRVVPLPADDDLPFQLCGINLMFRAMTLCKPEMCPQIRRAPLMARARFGSIQGAIAKECCTKACRPSQVSAICCGL